MAHISRSHFEGEVYDPPARRLWHFVRRYELIELFVIIGGIVAAWLGTSVGASFL